MEGEINDKAARAALRSMAKGKSPGPDRLPAEFYHAFEQIILDDFVRMITESLHRGEFDAIDASGRG